MDSVQLPTLWTLSNCQLCGLGPIANSVDSVQLTTLWTRSNCQLYGLCLIANSVYSVQLPTLWTLSNCQFCMDSVQLPILLDSVQLQTLFTLSNYQLCGLCPISNSEDSVQLPTLWIISMQLPTLRTVANYFVLCPL